MLLQRTVMYNRLINSPFSVVGHDDLQAYRGIQDGLQPAATVGQPAPQLRSEAEIGQADVTTNGTSEISMRNQYRAWARYMTEPNAIDAGRGAPR